MLHDFLNTHRAELIARCRENVSRRTAPDRAGKELDYGITVFLDQLIRTLAVEDAVDPTLSRHISGPSDGHPAGSEIGETAAHHGRELLQHGFTIDEVVHDYGDLCQAITGLAFERNEPIETAEFRSLNRCLDNAIATAVTEFGYHRDTTESALRDDAFNERLGAFAHELRNYLSTATLAVAVIRQGNVGLSGATGAVLDRSLVGLRNLIDRSLAQVRLGAGPLPEHSLFALSEFIAEVKLSASLEADIRGCALIVTTVDPPLALSGDRDLLLAAVGNLLQNAFKFSHADGEVTLNAYAAADRILIDVEDSCGGLADGVVATMFNPFVQAGADRTGVGLGLSIARASVEANGGILRVRNIPGTGCVFTIDLPRHRQPEAPPATDLTRQDVLQST